MADNPSPTQEVEPWTIRRCLKCGCVHDFPDLPCPQCESMIHKRIEVLDVEDHQRLLQAERKQGEDEAESRLYAFFDDDEFPEAQLRFKLGVETRRADQAESQLQAEVEKREEVEREADEASAAADEFEAQRNDERDRAEAAESRLSSVEAVLTKLMERVERDRREADKILCHLQSAKGQLLRDKGTEQGESR